MAGSIPAGTTMENKIEIGAIVELKSGGPQMTVMAVADDQVSCIWFQKHNRVSFAAHPIRETFHTGALRVIV